jgi:hypothetical protein
MSSRCNNRSRANQTSTLHVLKLFLFVRHFFIYPVMFPRMCQHGVFCDHGRNGVIAFAYRCAPCPQQSRAPTHLVYRRPFSTSAAEGQPKAIVRYLQSRLLQLAAGRLV